MAPGLNIINSLLPILGGGASTTTTTIATVPAFSCASSSIVTSTIYTIITTSAGISYPSPFPTSTSFITVTTSGSAPSLSESVLETTATDPFVASNPAYVFPTGMLSSALVPEYQLISA